MYPNTFNSQACRQVASSILSIEPPGMSPALLTRMSMSEASLTRRAISSPLRRSVTWVAAVIRTRLPRRCRSMDFSLLLDGVSEEGRRKWIGGMQPRSTLHCSVAPRRRLVHCRASRIGGAIVPASHKEVLDEQQEAISDRGHPRRRHRQGSDARGPARHRDGGEKA